MALPILDGNQSATTLSSIFTSGEHIPAHTVVSLGTQAITNIATAVSGSVVSISNFPATQPVSIASVTVGNTVTIAGTVTANPTGTQTIAGSVTLGAGTAQIGSVTASISNFPATQAISIASVTIGNSVTIGSLPAISGTVTATIRNGEDAILNDAPSGYTAIRALSHWFDDVVDNEIKTTSQTYPLPISGTVTIGSLPAISGTVTANTFALQGTAVTTSDFTSTTASTLLASFNATREVLTIFNEGAGNLHICPGATCTTIAYQVRLSSGDYYEVPNHQTTITHSAVFQTAGTARVTQVS